MKQYKPKSNIPKMDQWDAENILLALILILIILFADSFAELIADKLLANIFSS